MKKYIKEILKKTYCGTAVLCRHKSPAYGNGEVGKFIQVVIVQLDPFLEDRKESVHNLIDIVSEVFNKTANSNSQKHRQSRA